MPTCIQSQIGHARWHSDCGEIKFATESIADVSLLMLNQMMLQLYNMPCITCHRALVANAIGKDALD